MPRQQHLKSIYGDGIEVNIHCNGNQFLLKEISKKLPHAKIQDQYHVN